MICLGVECTAHTISVGICDEKGVRANEIATHPFSKEGLIPRKLADHHTANFIKVLNKALEKGGCAIEEVDVIAVSQGPGIGAPLSVGIGAAKYLALKYKKPLVGVNHPLAHVKISEWQCRARDPLVLYLSGGNSQIIVKKGEFEYYVIGETLDMGMGNLFDSFAREVGLEPAHGGELARRAEKGEYFYLPYTVKGMNLVFSGLFTAAKKHIGKRPVEDLAKALMETAFAMSCEVTERALFLTKKKELIACGGVAQNRRLQEMLRIMCSEIGVKFGVAEDQFNRDNGAMIAYTGMLIYKKYGGFEGEEISTFEPLPKYRIDQVEEVLSITPPPPPRP